MSATIYMHPTQACSPASASRIERETKRVAVIAGSRVLLLERGGAAAGANITATFNRSKT